MQLGCRAASAICNARATVWQVGQIIITPVANTTSFQSGTYCKKVNEVPNGLTCVFSSNIQRQEILQRSQTIAVRSSGLAIIPATPDCRANQAQREVRNRPRPTKKSALVEAKLVYNTSLWIFH